MDDPGAGNRTGFPVTDDKTASYVPSHHGRTGRRVEAGTFLAKYPGEGKSEFSFQTAGNGTGRSMEATDAFESHAR